MPLFGFALATFLALGVVEKAAAEKFRIAAWNINNLNAVTGEALRSGAPIRSDADYELLRSYADQLDADIVALQEMGSPEAVKRVFSSDEFEVVFSGRYNEANDPDIYTALVVRRDRITVIESGDYKDLSVVHETDQRLTRRGVEARLEADGQQFWVLSVHLKSWCFGWSITPPANEHCETLGKQIRPLEIWIDEKEASGLPLIVAGDFNRKFDIHGNADHICREIDDADTPQLDLWRLPFRTASNCPTTRPRYREHPIDFLVFNQIAWNAVDQASFIELAYDVAQAQEVGDRLSDHCPIAVDLTFSN